MSIFIYTIIFLGFVGLNAHAENSACPMFHCNPEATTVVNKAIVANRIKVANSNLGQLKAQGCSSDGTYLACIYFTDEATGVARGVVKVLDAATMQPLWGSEGATNSYNLNIGDVSPGQVPVFLENQKKISAGDSSRYVRYDLLTGEADANYISISGASVMGMTPISNNLGVITQTDGVMTLIDLINWKKLDQITIVDPLNKDPISLVSPSTGSNDVIYSVVVNKKSNNAGYLISVICDSTKLKLAQKSYYSYNGVSGASAIVLKPAQTGLSQNLILFHAPASAELNQNSITAVIDEVDAFHLKWRIPLASSLQVTPTVDDVSKNIYYQLSDQNVIFRNNYMDGASSGSFNIQNLGAFASSFKLNGHLAASQSAAGFSLLLAGSVPSGDVGAGQYIISFFPAGTGDLGWIKKIGARGDLYTAAWNFYSPGRNLNTVCPIIVGYKSGLTKLCNK
jgi:hypothetical protein